MLDSLRSTYHRLIDRQSTTHFRYLYHSFSFKERLTGIIGPRGVGKTTLMLQCIKNHFPDLNKTFYFSADHIYFNTHTIYQFIETLYQHEGITVFFIDEIHKYASWNQELKNIYDSFPDIKIVFSGSSSLDLVKGSYDLSRRATLYPLHGLSFREYLIFKMATTDIKPSGFDALLKNPSHFNTFFSSTAKLKGYFKDYLSHGYYPFFLEDSATYYDKILRIIEKTIYEDIAGFYKLKTQHLPIFKQILNYLATLEPGSFSVHNVAKNLGVDSKTIAHYISILKETGLIRVVLPYAKGNQILRKPEKVFLNNTTLLYAIHSALGENNSVGLVRELFFLQNLQNAGIHVFHSKQGDYRTQHATFEIGGKNKTNQQLKGIALPAYLIKDDILHGSNKEIPLMCFGFLY